MKEKFVITGMSCSACSAKIEKEVNKLPGIQSASVNLLANSMEAELDESRITVGEIISRIDSLGYGARVKSQKTAVQAAPVDPVQNELKDMKKRVIYSFLLLVPLMYISMGSMVGLPLPFFLDGMNNAASFALSQLLFTIPIVFINRKYYVNGFGSLFRGSPNMDSLIAVGSSAALIYGVFATFKISYALGAGDMATVHHYHMDLYFESAAMILALITFGKFLETKSKGKTGEAITKLMDLSPKMALVERNGAEVEIPTAELLVGDIVVLRPGARIPADGSVLEGQTAVDESAITGESIPAEKGPGDKLTAATVNTWGFVKFTAEKVGEDTAFAEIIRLVEEAGAKKAPIAKLADKISGVFVPVVMVIALLATVLWLVFGAEFEFALSIGISILVISCPCALGLATPVAVMVGTGKGAEIGILIKSGEAFETAHKIDTVVLDKTGTVTTGKHQVTRVMEKDPLLAAVALSLESLSEHPLAKAVTSYYAGQELKPVESFAAVPGLGVTGVIDGVEYFGGNLRLIRENTNVPPPQLPNEGTPLIFASREKLLGVVLTGDQMKDDSPEAIALLKKMKIRTILLTGDNRKTAAYIGGLAGVDEVISEVLPAEKEQKVRELMNSGKTVAMVGDGVNDAPALTAANVGFAIGSGVDAAVESADIVLTGGSLMTVPNAIRLSKNVMRNIKQNLFWAFFYNTVGIPIAAGVFFTAFGLRLNPMLGALAMSLSSVCVVLNALRIKNFKPAAPQRINQTPKGEENKMKKITIEGMMCSHCEMSVKKALTALDPEATVNLSEKCAYVKDSVTDEAIKTAITDAGYQVVGIA